MPGAGVILGWHGPCGRRRKIGGAMSDTTTLDDIIEASAAALAIPIDPAWLPAIRMNLEVAIRLAQAFDKFPLPDEAEPAPVFEA